MNRQIKSFLGRVALGLALLFPMAVSAQTAARTLKDSLPTLTITDDLSLHIHSPEPIQYADISGKALAGDLPLENVLRLKVRTDSLGSTDVFGFLQRDLGIITLVGEHYMAQYHIVYTPERQHPGLVSSINVQPGDMQPLDVPGIGLTHPEMKAYCQLAMRQKPSYFNVSAKAYGLTVMLNNLFTVGDYIFLDITYVNSSRLRYDPDQIRFKIEDKKISKATNVQSVEIQPIFTLYKISAFKKRYHNVFVFKKFTFPDEKTLAVEMTEAQLSGRTIRLDIDYKDLLNADSL